ncbi:MAG: hypothetical protein IKK94_08435, partial [Clostridia bacterium]|nr:hypothetical protein [Clostridia bacterium]
MLVNSSTISCLKANEIILIILVIQRKSHEEFQIFLIHFTFFPFCFLLLTKQIFDDKIKQKTGGFLYEKTTCNAFCC